ncbi:MAG: AarF/ABC1/UbiB kinase family protein [Myxococcales bacterium]|nr:AarF/ABC1/UbiB kinase family protein [Myxococcales bacterium]MCB9705054.1 AarF/ABC1/UbiB kinase family protein [Myxococcales bacterium]
MTDERKLPTGRLGRWVRLAGAGARAGASVLLGKGDDEAALRAAEMLGTLRGLAAKLGQMASYVDGLVPEEQRERYERALGGLQSRAATSSGPAIRALVEEELGAPVTELFASFEERPFASASIGQVHRARLHDGREVAVKVQHPGIARAMESDLAGAGVIEAAIGLLGMRALGSERMLDEVRARFREELDYTLEAARQKVFAEIHADDPTIRVPAVIDDRSSARVLTTELVGGRSLDEAASDDDEAARSAWCATLWRFVYKATIVGGVFNADPHPGNYFFGGPGEVTFLDFGCVQKAEPGRQELARILHRAAAERDDVAFDQAAREMLRTRGGEYEAAVVAYLRKAFAPQRESPFRITRPYVADLVGQVKALALASRRNSDGSVVSMPPGVFFMNRLQFGFYSVLARFDAVVDYAAVEREFLDLPAQPPPP